MSISDLSDAKLIVDYKEIMVIVNLSMNKKSQSTKILIKPKAAHHTPKVMLVDLCPEEKAKIGDLIKALETRKV